MKNKRRIVSVWIMLTLMVLTIPLLRETVYAEPSMETIDVIYSGELRDALEREGDVHLVVKRDITFETIKGRDPFDDIEVKGNKILDLNGHTIIYYDYSNWIDEEIVPNTSHMIRIPADASLTVMDSAGNGRLSFDGATIGGYHGYDYMRGTERNIFEVEGTLTINSGYFKPGSIKNHYLVAEAGMVNQVVGGRTAGVLKGGKLIVNGGELTGYDKEAVYLEKGGSAVINHGIFQGYAGASIFSFEKKDYTAADLTIYQGYFKTYSLNNVRWSDQYYSTYNTCAVGDAPAGGLHIPDQAWKDRSDELLVLQQIYYDETKYGAESLENKKALDLYDYNNEIGIVIRPIAVTTLSPAMPEGESYIDLGSVLAETNELNINFAIKAENLEEYFSKISDYPCTMETTIRIYDKDGYLIHYTPGETSINFKTIAERFGAMNYTIELTVQAMHRNNVIAKVVRTYDVAVKKPIYSVDVSVPSAVVGKTPLFDASCDHSNVSIASVEWLEIVPDLGPIEMRVIDKFESGTTYRCKVTLKPDEDYAFLKGSDFIFTINGKEAVLDRETNTAYVEYSLQSVSDLLDFGTQSPAVSEADKEKGYTDLGTVYLGTSEMDIVFGFDEPELSDELKNSGYTISSSTTVEKDYSEYDSKDGDGNYNFKYEVTQEGFYQITQEIVLSQNGKVVDYITHDYRIQVVKPVYLYEVEANVTAPLAGAHPLDAVSATDDVKVTHTSWFQVEGEDETELPSSGTFANGVTYRCYVKFEAAEGYTFAKGTTAMFSSENAINLNADSERSEIYCYYDYRVETPNFKVKYPYIPVAGMSASGNTRSPIVYSNMSYDVQNVKWFDAAGKEFTGVYEGGKNYKLQIVLVGHANQTGLSVKVTLDGEVPEFTVQNDTKDYVITIEKEYTVASRYISISNLNRPAAGESAQDELSYTFDTNMTCKVQKVYWYDAKGNEFTGTFETGNTYTVGFHIVAGGTDKLVNFGVMVNGAYPTSHEVRSTKTEGMIYQEYKIPDVSVIFTPDSKPRTEGFMTVDIEAFADQDEELMEAYFEDAVRYQWYKDGEAIEGANDVTMTFVQEDEGHEFYVEVLYGNNTVRSVAFIIMQGHVHEWTEATCTKPKVCSTCGKTEGEPLGHKESEWFTDARMHWKICLNSGCKRFFTETRGEHEYGADYICDVCGYNSFKNPFKDVQESDWFYKDVMWGAQNKIVAGIQPDLFFPYEICTRAQIVTFIWRAAGKPAASTTECTFKDVSKDAYYYDAMLWGTENKIIHGYNADTFAPDNTCTRAELVTFLWRLDGFSVIPGAENPFGDVSTSDWFYNAVLWAKAKNITSGYTPTTFGPNYVIIRAETVAMLHRYYKE